MPEPEDRDLNVGDGILGPEDEGSMAFKLARAAEAPQAQVELSPEEIEAARQAELDAEAVAAAAAADEAAAAGTDGAKAGEPPEPPKLKFDTLEDYDKALKAAETRMHTATTETSEERKAREALETEVAELRAKEEARAAEAARPAAIEANKAAYAEALKKIKEIPVTRDEEGNLVYPDDYDDQVAAAWASTAPDPEKIIEEVTKRAEAKEAARRAAADAATAEQREADEAARITADAEKLAAEAGLDMTPGSADYRLFYSHVDELKKNPDHEYRNKPFEEQVKWATSGVRQILGKKIELTDAERAAARRTQTRNAVLERGVTRVAPAEPKRQRSMQEILGQSS
jgi:hypothetical protein